jgi:hypothetical protein
VATSSGFGWRIAAELGGDIKRNSQDSNKVNILPYMDIFKLKDKVDYFESETEVKRYWPEEILKES